MLVVLPLREASDVAARSGVLDEGLVLLQIVCHAEPILGPRMHDVCAHVIHNQVLHRFLVVVELCEQFPTASVPEAHSKVVAACDNEVWRFAHGCDATPVRVELPQLLAAALARWLVRPTAEEAVVVTHENLPTGRRNYGATRRRLRQHRCDGHVVRKVDDENLALVGDTAHRVARRTEGETRDLSGMRNGLKRRRQVRRKKTPKLAIARPAN
mmetsp:Transcript_65741/g.183084  ORF Transcript_65741/g.183084 Transcript_65741/m.183084 type:complete len:213 (+) Transcript_65741:418-1056(+)